MKSINLLLVLYSTVCVAQSFLDISAVNAVLTVAHSRTTFVKCPELGSFLNDIQCRDEQIVKINTYVSADFFGQPLAPFLSSQIGVLSSLEYLSINGLLGGLGLYGAIPTALNQLTALTYLDLSANQLRGVIPDLSGLTKLTYCRLAAPKRLNRFCCPLPPLPEACRKFVSDGLEYTLRCNPFVGCSSGSVLKFSTGKQELASLPGTWKGKASLQTIVSRRDNEDDSLLTCQSTPYEQQISLEIGSNLKLTASPSPVFLISEIITLTSHEIDYSFMDGKIGGFDPATKMVGIEIGRGGIECMYIERPAPDQLVLYFHQVAGELDSCQDRLLVLPAIGTCVRRDMNQLATKAERALRYPGFERYTIRFALQRSGNPLPPFSAVSTAAPAAASTRSGATTNLNGDASTTVSLFVNATPESDDFILIICVIAGAVCLCFCIVVVTIVCVVRRLAPRDDRHGNPIYVNASLHDLSPRNPSRHDASWHSTNDPSEYRGSAMPSTSDHRNSAARNTTSDYRGDVQQSKQRGIAASGSGSNAQFGDVIIDPRELHKGKKIGEGAFGFVYVGTYRNEKVAIKEAIKGHETDPGYSTTGYAIASYTNKELSAFKQEAARMKKLAPHRNVVPFYGVCLVPNFAIVSLYCDGGSLDVLLFESPDDISPERRLSWTKDIAHGVAHLHNEGIVHRDIAARNVLLTSDDVAMLTDFGLAREGDSTAASENISGHTKSTIGPVRWMAPEQLSELKYSKKSDVYMWAATIYEIYDRKLPWADDELPKAIYRIMSGEKLRLPPNTPTAVAAIAQRCLSFAPGDRPSFSEIVAALSQTAAVPGGAVAGQSICDVCGAAYPSDAALAVHKTRRH